MVLVGVVRDGAVGVDGAVGLGLVVVVELVSGSLGGAERATGSTTAAVPLTSYRNEPLQRSHSESDGPPGEQLSLTQVPMARVLEDSDSKRSPSTSR